MSVKALSYGRQTVDDVDIDGVVDVLRSDFLTQGPRVEEFENTVAAYTGAKYAVACSSGTAALHLACLAAGLGPNDGVLTSPNTFLASANAPLYVGATPVFADIDPESGNISAEAAAKVLSTRYDIKALIPVHYSGRPVDMEEISGLARKHSLVVIEDACHALGASWCDGEGRWHNVGDCSRSDMTVFSFHPVKSITTGEGGMITTNDRELAEKLRSLRSHGVVKDPLRLVLGEPAPWYYEMQELGYNYRITDIQCSLGTSQMKKLDSFIERRCEIAALYSSLFNGYPHIRTPFVSETARCAWHLYPVRIDFESIGLERAALFAMMDDAGVRLQVHYIPVHLQPYYRKRFGTGPGDFPAAESFYATEVSLPIYPGLTDDEVKSVASLLKTTIDAAVGRNVRRVSAG